MENFTQPALSDRDPGFYVVRARYAGRWNGKPQFAVKCQGGGNGFKTRAMRLIGDHLKGRWSGRENAYIVSAAKVEKLKALYLAGRDCSFITGELEPVREVTEG